MPTPSLLQKIFDKLLAEFGPQNWWPGETPLEIVVGAVLTQNTNWQNVERAIANLREAGVLSLQGIRNLPIKELAELIRPAGYFRLKARRLRNVLDFIHRHYDGSLEAIIHDDLESARQRLLEINGIGPETADSILLYAAGKPTFVIDAYTHRVMKRHGWVEPELDYDGLKEVFESGLATDAAMFNEYHALLVQVGKHFCRRQARCDACPLRDLLPEGGPIEPER